MKITCNQIEVAVVRLFGTNRNLIVPNISWGLNLHECDLLIVNKNRYATEVEIKVSKSDLKADLKKLHAHQSNRIKNLYYAMPADIVELAKEILPEYAGIIQCTKRFNTPSSPLIAEIIRKPRPKHTYIKMPEKDIYNIARLGVMRFWNLKTARVMSEVMSEK